MQITDKEMRVLRAIVTNKLNAFKGVIPEQYDAAGLTTESKCVNVAYEPSDVHGPAFSGVVAGLRRKGLVSCDGKGTKTIPYTITPTELGFQACTVGYISKIVIPAGVNVCAALAVAAQTEAAPAGEACYATDALLAKHGG